MALVSNGLLLSSFILPMHMFIDTYQVYADNEGVWDAMLNQTDVGKNANKYVSRRSLSDACSE